MFKNHNTILAMGAILDRAFLDSDPSLSVDEKYAIICTTGYFLQYYDKIGWLEYHKHMNSELSSVAAIVKYYEDKDGSLKIKHDKLYYFFARGIEI